MKLTGINMTNIKQSNQTAVLYLLSREGKLSRKDIADRLGLTPAGVTKICRELLTSGKIIEVGECDEAVKAGRKKILISINSEDFFVIGISIELDYCCYGIYDVSGREILSSQKSFDEKKAPEKFLEELSDNINDLIRKSEIKRTSILGAGVGIVGSVDDNGTTAGKYGVWQEGVQVKEILVRALKMPVKVENNVKAFVIAQAVFGGGTNEKNQLFIKWGPGVGSAILIDGEVFSSNSNGEAEIGHYIVHPNGTPCRCGRKGCLETHVSAGAIVSRIKQSYSKERTPLLFEKTSGDKEKITYELIAENIDSLDDEVIGIINRRINRMSRAVVNFATLLDPDAVVLFGYMFDKKTTEKFIEYCKSYYSKFNENFISVSPFFEKSKYIGPVALALKNLFFEG